MITGIGVSLTYSDICCPTSEMNTLATVTSRAFMMPGAMLS